MIIEPEIMCEESEYLWFVSKYYNGLFRYNKSDEQIELITELSERKEECIKLICLDEKIFIIYKSNVKIDVFDKKNNEVHIIVLGNNGKEQFGDAYEYNGWIYCFPENFGIIYGIDTKKEVINEISILDKNNKIESVEYYTPVVQKNNVFYGLLFEKNIFYVFDCVSKDIFFLSIIPTHKDGIIASIACSDTYMFGYDKKYKQIEAYDLSTMSCLSTVGLNLSKEWRIRTCAKGLIVNSLYDQEYMVLDEQFKLLFSKTGGKKSGDTVCVGTLDYRGKYYYDFYDNVLRGVSKDMDFVGSFEINDTNLIYRVIDSNRGDSVNEKKGLCMEEWLNAIKKN